MEFNSIEESFSYKGIDTSNITKFEYDDCVFAIDNSDDFSIHTVTKSNGKFKLVDFNADEVEYTEPDAHPLGGYVESPKIAKYNKDTDQTFYCIGVVVDEKPNENGVMLGGNVMKYYSTSKLTFGMNNGDDYWIFTCIDNAPPKTSLSFIAGDFSTRIVKTPYIRGITDND